MDVKEFFLVLSSLKLLVNELSQNCRFCSISYESLGYEEKNKCFVTVFVPLNNKPGIPEFFFKVANFII